MVAKALDKSGIKTPLESWDEDTVKKLVEFFMDERFPTIVVRRTQQISMPDWGMDGLTWGRRTVLSRR